MRKLVGCVTTAIANCLLAHLHKEKAITVGSSARHAILAHWHTSSVVSQPVLSVQESPEVA